jgi:hypothetical protein
LGISRPRSLSAIARTRMRRRRRDRVWRRRGDRAWRLIAPRPRAGRRGGRAARGATGPLRRERGRSPGAPPLRLCACTPAVGHAVASAGARHDRQRAQACAP